MKTHYLLLLLGLFLLSPDAAAQDVARNKRVEAREAEWKAYAIPEALFTRVVDSEKQFVFRIPADWKQDANGRTATGPHSVSFEVFTEKVPEGSSLLDYVGAVMQAVRHLPGAPEAALVRKTILQDLEAREIVLQMPDASGEMTRTVLWMTIRGPAAIGFKFSAPIAHTSEQEPYFKAIVQSMMFVRGFNYRAFETAHSIAIKASKPSPLREIQSIVMKIVEQGFVSDAHVNRLASLFSETPEAVVDLLFDSRPFVRAAAVQALTATRNSSLEPFLWITLHDPEPLIASYAAEVVATKPDVISKLAEQSFGGFKTETLARVWPFLSKNTRIQILQSVFGRPASKPPQGTQTKVTVSVAELQPHVPGRPPKPLNVIGSAMAYDPSVQLGALTLLKYTSQDEFKLPLPIILAANQDTLTVAALQVAIERGEPLAVDALIKLTASSNLEIRKLAAESLGLSGGIDDVERIQALTDRKKPGADQVPVADLKLAIEKIRFREQLSSAAKTSAAAETDTIKKGLANSTISAFVWRYVCEPSPSRCGLKTPTRIDQKQFVVQPFGENLLPENPLHFAAIPKPAEAVQKLYQTVHSIQMDSARAQSNMALVLGTLREIAGRQLGALNDSRPLIEFTGINGDSPIAFAGWVANGANSTVEHSRRNAVILRVTNRQQFERFITVYQGSVGKFSELPHNVAVFTRLFPALPAVLPLAAKKTLIESPARPKSDFLERFSAVANFKWNGFEIKAIEHTTINEVGRIEPKITYLTYLGETAVLAPDLETIRELLEQTALGDSGRRTLSYNPEFRRSVEAGGEVIYFSNVASALNIEQGNEKAGSFKLTESGQLKFSKSSWENVHRLTFDESDWSKPLVAFHPRDLESPRLFLPGQTLAYYFMHLDVPAAWAKWLKTSLPSDQIKVLNDLWALDFGREVLPELGTECGIALLEWPDLETPEGAGLLVFFKLKNDKLANALKDGKLFRNIGPTNQPVEIKFGTTSSFVTVQKGFLVFSNQASGLKALDSSELLASSSDYSKSVAKATDSVVAFAGYNLQAATALVRRTGTDGLQMRQADILFSVAQAFHSPSFFARALPNAVEARSSVAMDREGRYAVSDINYTKSSVISYVTLESSGLPLTDQKRLSRLSLRLRTRTPGALESLKKDVATESQTTELTSAEELLLTVKSRRIGPYQPIALPIADPSLKQFLVATPEIQSTNQEVIKQAKEIAGNDKDAWSVARKLADWTHKNLEWKLITRADASQTLASREADCSEFSQLYVAMARSLGLPARIVSGLAYSGSTFGAHAWVEVWCGKWIELDPTWGTDFVDATHVRSLSDDLISYAALNTIDLEVLEAHRSAADFQLTPEALTKELIKTIPARSIAALEASLNLELLTNQLMGPGEWNKLNALEREELSSAYTRVMVELLSLFDDEIADKKSKEESESTTPTRRMRLLRIDEKGDSATATCYVEASEMLMKLYLKRDNGGWYLMEFAQADLDLQIIAETLQPTIEAIRARRAGQKQNPLGMSEFLRAVLLLETNLPKSIEVLDAALKTNPSLERLRLLKANALLASENTNEVEAKKLLTGLVEQPQPYAPAIYRLASWYRVSEEEGERKKGVELLWKYLELEPADIRAHRALAVIYNLSKDGAAAEAALRKVVEIDPSGVAGYLSLAEFLILAERLPEASAVLTQGEKHKSPKDDLFGQLMESLYFSEEYAAAEKFAASEPNRMKASATANLTLAAVHVDNNRPLRALPLLKFAATLDRKSDEAHVTLAQVYRSLSRWPLALAAADEAVRRDFQSGPAHYERACALARLGRTREALDALKRAVELSSFYGTMISGEKDLKSLSSLAEFKKLIVKPDAEP